MLRRSRVLAVLMSGLLGLAAAGGVAACGGEGSREDPERGNPGGQSEGGQSTIRTGPTTLGSTAPEADGVTQTQTDTQGQTQTSP